MQFLPHMGSPCSPLAKSTTIYLGPREHDYVAEVTCVVEGAPPGLQHTRS